MGTNGVTRQRVYAVLDIKTTRRRDEEAGEGDGETKFV